MYPKGPGGIFVVAVFFFASILGVGGVDLPIADMPHAGSWGPHNLGLNLLKLDGGFHIKHGLL